MLPVEMPPPPVIVPVWGDETISRWQELCEGEEHGAGAQVLGTMIYIESSGDPNAINEAEHAIGLMQIRSDEAFAGRPTETELLVPDYNVAFGSGYLAAQLNEYCDLRKALMAYNAGPGWMDANPDATDNPGGYVGKFSRAWSFLWEEPLPWMVREIPFSETRAKMEESLRFIEAAMASMEQARRWTLEAIEEMRAIEGV